MSPCKPSFQTPRYPFLPCYPTLQVNKTKKVELNAQKQKKNRQKQNKKKDKKKGAEKRNNKPNDPNRRYAEETRCAMLCERSMVCAVMCSVVVSVGMTLVYSFYAPSITSW